MLLKTFPQRKLQAQMTFLVNCINHLKKENTKPTYAEKYRRQAFLNLFSEINITSIPKPDKDSSKKPKTLMSLLNTDRKNP